jgi:hypothetical protein
VLLDLSRRLGRILGFVDTGAGTSGSHVDAALAGGDPFFFTVPNVASGEFFAPSVTFTGTTLNWDYTGVPAATDTRIFYGIY